MPGPLSQIASFNSDVAAQLARARLDAAGIQSFLTNEYGSLGGGGSVGLQVAEADAERARSLLGATPPTGTTGPTDPASSSDEQVSHCMMCRSGELEPVDLALPLRVLRSLVLMAVPLPAEWFAGRRTRCLNCGYEQPAP